MRKVLIISIFNIISFIRTVLFFFNAIGMRCLFPPINRRWKKEGYNFKKRKYYDLNFNADYAFEVSSQGELEQSLPIIEYLVNNNKKVELIYCSESVDIECKNLENIYPSLIRTIMLPIVRYSFFYILGGQSVHRWLSAKKLIFCRYDFFPELLSLKFKGIELSLISGSLKGKNINVYNRWLYSFIYNFFTKIILVSNHQKQLFSFVNHNAMNYIYDFRINRIQKRLEVANKTLNNNEFYLRFSKWLFNYEKHQRIIIGNAWKQDIEVLNDNEFIEKIKKGKFSVAIVPHKLSHSSIIKKKIKDIGLYNCQHIMVLEVKGILCELYSLFSWSMVGGGFNRSVHSLWEAHLANTFVFCGPKVFRSTEYDSIIENDGRIVVLKRARDFYKHLCISNIDVLKVRNYRQNFQSALSFILGENNDR